MLPRFLASIGIALVLFVAIGVSLARFVVPTAKTEGWIPLDPPAQQRPISVWIDPENSPAREEPPGMRGRFFLISDRRWFQPQDSSELFMVSGDTVSLDRFFSRYVTEPQRYAATGEWIPDKPLRNYVCLSALLTGRVEVTPANNSYAPKTLHIERLLSIEVLDLESHECIRWPMIP